jgi:chaperonin GroES
MSIQEFVEPLGSRLLIRKDEARNTTKGGIVLPDQAEIPTITGRVVEISAQIANDEDFPVKKYDKVLFHPKHAIPVDLESDNVLFVVEIDAVVAVFRRSPRSEESVDSIDDADERDDF